MQNNRIKLFDAVRDKELLGRDMFRFLVKEYWHSVFFLGFLILYSEFSMLEKYIVPQYWISCTVDQLIPFIPAFVVPYVFWFPMIAVVLVLLCFSDRGDFIRTIMLIYSGMTVAMLIYLVLPHGQPLRPIVTGNDFFSRTIRFSIYANDTNTNCFPSIHVLNQMAIHIGLCKSKLFSRYRGWKVFSFVATVLICASTCFIKQHSVLDVAAAIIIGTALYYIVFKLDWLQILPFALRVRLSGRKVRDN